jgi:hypothetical protein
MNRIEKFFSLAAEEAKQSDMHYKHGAVIVKGGHVVAKGHNSRRSRVEGENYWYYFLYHLKFTTMLIAPRPQLHPRRNELPVSF